MLNDWRLTYPGTNLAFGTIASRYVFPQDGPPEVSNLTVRDEDADRPRADGTIFGQDFRDSRTVTFDIEVNGDTEPATLLLEQDLAAAWRGDSIRNTPNAMATLTAHTGRSVFGRPRRYQPKYDLLPFGVTAVTCDFATADDLWYGAEEFATVNLVPTGTGGGLKAPLVAPLSTSATSDRSQTITIGGQVPTWPVITITGPITNPQIEVLGQFKLGFNLTLAYDQSLVIDTRPWARTVLNNNGSVAGSLMPAFDRLSDARLSPGRYELALRGASSTGTPRATFAWRSAYTTF